jgi:hypothetical protein
MSLFEEEDNEYEKARKMKFIEDCCMRAETVINEAESDEVLFDLITKWNEPKIVSYQMTVLARKGMLEDEDDT